MPSGERPLFGRIDVPLQPTSDVYARKLLRDLFSPSSSVYMDSIRTDRNGVLSNIRRRMDRAREISPGLVLNRVTITTLGVQEVSSELEELATHMQGRQDLARMYNEVAIGIDGVISPLISAHEHIVGAETRDAESLSTAEASLGIQLGAEGTQEFLEQQQADYERIMESLRKDPSGKSAVYRGVKQLTREARTMRGLTPVYLIAGAEFAEKYYGALYPFIDPLLPQPA